MPFSRAISATTAANFFKMLDRSLGLGMMARPRAELAIAQRAKLTAQRLPGHADAELLPQPLTEIDQPPPHNIVDRGDRTVLDHGHQRLPMRFGQSRLGARCLAVDQTIRSFRVEPQHPVPDDLQPDIADTRRVPATAAIIDLRQSQKPTGLSRILRASRQTSKIRTSKVGSERDRR
jgi:hypothetical protein